MYYHALVSLEHAIGVGGVCPYTPHNSNSRRIMLLSIPGAYGLFFDTYFHTLIPREPPFNGFNFYIEKKQRKRRFSTNKW